MRDRIGQYVDDYHLVRRLGTGTFGEVYLGEHVRDQSQVAVKVLLLTQENLKGFIREASTTFRLRHPHIIQLLSFGISADDAPYLIMAYASNGTLRDRHPKGARLALNTAISYLLPLASALQYAHDRRVVHRDVKPENVLIGPVGKVLLSDFGIAVVAPIEHSLSMQNLAGTVPYMAPEQIRGKPLPASDQYALGIMIYEWLCGVRPFQGSQWEVLEQQRSSPPPPLREKCPDLSPQAEEIILKALAKDPQDRFACVQDFATALAESGQTYSFSFPTFSSSLPPSSLPVVPPPLATTSDPFLIPFSSVPSAGFAPSSDPKPTREGGISRRAAMVGLGLTGLAAASSGIVWWVTSQDQGKHNPSRPTATPSPTFPPGFLFFTYRQHTKFVMDVAWSLDGKRIASAGDDQKVQIWNASTGTNLLTYRKHSDVVPTVVWSPDRQHIASGSWDDTVQIWDATNGSPVVTHTLQGRSGVNAVTWSPTGRRLASGGYDQIVQVWDASTGDTLFTYRGHIGGGSSFSVRTIAWSPDGKRIASGGGTDSSVHVWDASSGGNVLYYQGNESSVNKVAWSHDGKRLASAGGDQMVRIWDTNTGDILLTYRGHVDSNSPGGLFSVAWSPDDKRIASSDYPGTVHVWNASTGADAFIYRGHHGTVDSVAWSPDGKRIASGGDDTTVQVWQA